MNVGQNPGANRERTDLHAVMNALGVVATPDAHILTGIRRQGTEYCCGDSEKELVKGDAMTHYSPFFA